MINYATQQGVRRNKKWSELFVIEHHMKQWIDYYAVQYLEASDLRTKNIIHQMQKWRCMIEYAAQQGARRIMKWSELYVIEHQKNQKTSMQYTV